MKNQPKPNHQIFIGGNVLTISDGRAEAVAVRDGKIEAVGRTAEIRARITPQTSVIELKGKTLMPAFIDAHMHLVSQGLKETGYALDLSTASSLKAALARVEEAVSLRERGAWVRGRGWDEMLWPERRYISKSDLDKIAPYHPVALTRIDGHLLVANSEALKQVSITKNSDEFDAANGLLREKAVEEFARQTKPPLDEIEAAILAGCKLAHSLGITALHDFVVPDYIRAYQNLYRRGELSLRIQMHPFVEYLDSLKDLGFQTGFGNGMLKLGAIKFFTDGSIGARNAALFDPYVDEKPATTGKLNYDQTELNSLIQKTHESGFQLIIHAIGDQAIEAALNAIEYAGAKTDDRPRIEHLEMPTNEQLTRVKELGVIASMQPNFVQWSGPGKLYETRLGKERDSLIDPHRAVLQKGITLTFGSDGMPFNPLYGVHAAVNAPHAGQRLSVEEALKAYTWGAAYSGFDERALGTLEVGKRADLIVLSEDPSANPKHIDQIDVLETYLDAKLVYSQGAK
ncbi:amidohydrolase [Candidatus Acetothermia bacterium]|nr:amidohydrolase [Candidatus Acetothermia bacterium]MBI3644040.1 amidohydrolase [Candidatus Acetothermia bacterium]